MNLLAEIASLIIIETRTIASNAVETRTWEPSTFMNLQVEIASLIIIETRTIAPNTEETRV